MRHFILFFILFSALKTAAQQTSWELSNKNQTATYGEGILFYKNLAKQYSQAKLLSYGSTDFGKPLHLLILAKDKIFDPAQIRKNSDLYHSYL